MCTAAMTSPTSTLSTSSQDMEVQETLNGALLIFYTSPASSGSIVSQVPVSMTSITRTSLETTPPASCGGTSCSALMPSTRNMSSPRMGSLNNRGCFIFFAVF